MGRRNRKRSRERLARSTESRRESVNGQPTFDEISDMVEDAIEARLGIDDVTSDVCICDITTTTAIYTVVDEMGMYVEDDDRVLWQQNYSFDGTTVTLEGTATKVETSYVPAKEAARDAFAGRVLESRGTDSATGSRIFAVQIIDHGTSKNLRKYPAAVLNEAAHLYEGAKAFDHHRNDEELRTSTISGLVGQYRNVKANDRGIEGELHLLPGATHTAEAFDASLQAQAAGLAPLIGISHDVLALYRPVVEGGQRLQEATKIVRVLSADVVADPAAGGMATRMVAGGTGTDPKGQGMNLKQLLAALRTEADPAKRAELLKEHASVLEATGLTSDEVTAMVAEPAEGAGEENKELVGAAVGSASGMSAEQGASESVYAKASPLARMLIRSTVEGAQLGGDTDRAVEAITKRLPERFTENQLEQLVEMTRSIAADFVTADELGNMRPRVPGRASEGVTADEHDKKVKALDAFFAGDFQEGYHSFKQAFCDITGQNPYAADSEDFNRLILRESIGTGAFDSATRARESATTSTWALTLGDSVTRRLVTEYQEPSLQDWRSIVSLTPPINDFGTQRLDRIGGYGILPSVAQGAPYQPLTTPSEEEATYSIGKFGGTEDLTIETIANDDVRWISRIPKRLGLAAARTLHDTIWGILSTNPTCSYDSTALFHSNHSNTAAVALSYANYVSQRAAMRRQAGYGDSKNLLDLTPTLLIVPPELEGIGDQLCRGQYAPPATTPGATNVPNLAQGTKMIVKAFLSDTNDWFLAADPNVVPTVEVGFYLGRQDPELFMQSDPMVGAVFNADKLTWKIRHIWGYAVVDHRGFQRGTQ